MVKKIRPRAEIYYNTGNDGRDGSYDIAFFCPTCNRVIGAYKSDTACDECGTFYDWGSKKPTIIVKREIDWPIDTPVLNDEYLPCNTDATKMNYIGYNSHDSEAIYECPVCGKEYGGWQLYRIQADTKLNYMVCNSCNSKLAIPK